MIRTKSNCSWFLYLIALGSLLSLNLTVAAQTVYTIGGIPPQEILQGSALSFTLQSAGPGTGFSYSLDPGYPAPQGSIALDASTGAFAYTPSGSDKFEFRLTFTASMDGQPSESQSVLITPIAMVPPEGDIIAVVQQSAAVPDEASSDYVVVTQSQNAGPELFNTVQQTTINVEISGKTVIFDQNDQVHNLFTSFSGRPDMKNMSVYAETLIIRSPLKLPGTNLTVYARHLRFEDQTGQPPASIDTTPQPYLAAAAQLQNGNAGQAAGNVQLIIGDVYSDPGTNVRIVANGGKAQDAGQGAAGAPKPDYVPPNKGRFFNISQKDQHGEISWPYGNNPNGLVLAADGSLLQPPYPIVVSVTSDRCHELVMGQPPMWPEDGSDAIPPGTPGTGGSGGQVSATLQLTSLIQFVGGASGRPGLPQSGGPPQNPVFSGWFKTVNGRDCLNDHFDAEVVALHTSVAGKDAPSIPPAQPQGPDGAFTLIAESTQNRWLHPYWIRQVLAHVKDTYRGGNMQYATNVLQDYSNLLGSYQSSSGSIPTVTDPNLPPDANLQLQQASDEIQTLLHRLASNMDYFGNPAGWVPLLSLQATMNAFSGEVDADVPLLYLSLYLENKASQNSKDVTALQDGLNKLGDEATSTAADLDNVLQNVPSIQFQAAQVSTDLQNFQQKLQQREDELLAEAQRNVADQQKVPFWKKALRTISAVAEVVPAFQPALGTIGAGLNFITNVDTSQPLSSIVQNAPDLSSLFAPPPPTDPKAPPQQSGWAKSEASLNSFVKSVPFRSFKDMGSFASQWYNAWKDNSKTIDQILSEFKQTQAPADAVGQELSRIEAQDSEFNDLTQQVRSLQTEKETFTQKITTTMQSIAADNSTINKDLLSESSLYDNLNTTAGQFDHGMMTYVKDMERRARERLLRYQYYMAKAFEYRFLQTYPGNLNIDSTVQKIQSLVGDSYPANLDGIKALYLQSVRDIVNTGLTQLATQPPERSVPLNFNLTSSELQQLNQTGQVSIDLGPRIAGLPNEDDRHLEDLTVTSMTVNGSCSNNPFCRVRAVIQHNGLSSETWNGHTYNFNFGAGLDDQPFQWGASYDLLSGTLSPESFSLPGLSLLQTLLTGDTTPSPGVTLFALPGADGLITITQTQQPANLNAEITNMQLQATVDFYRSSSSQVELSVQPAAGNQPYTEISQADATGRTDGVGSFNRTYNPGTPVTLTAEPVFGALKFKDWVDGSGHVLSTSPALSLTLSSTASVDPEYTSLSAASPLSLSAAGVDFGNQVLGTSTASSVVVSNKGVSTVTLTNVSLVGANSSEYSLENGCGAIDAGGACTITMNFSPQGAGARTATLMLSYQGLGSPQAVPLTGNGLLEAQFDPGPPRDIRVKGDFDGDGKLDFAIWRPSTGTWWILPSSNPTSPMIQQWGLEGDIPVPGDYDGDGKTDFAIWRPSTGTWWILPSSNPTSPMIQQWGLQGDIPVPGDYDGDGKTDFAVWRPSNGTWYVITATGISSYPNPTIQQQWGLTGDLPVVGDYDGDGKTDFAVWRPSNGTWYVITATGISSYPNPTIQQQWGLLGDVPVVGDYDGDGKTDFGVWRPSNGTWYIITATGISSYPNPTIQQQWGLLGDEPM